MFDKIMTFLGKKPQCEIQRDIEVFIQSAKGHVEEYRKSVESVSKQRRLLELMAHHMGGLVWIKRWEVESCTYLYEFANKTHCDTFLKLPEQCLDDCTTHVSGKSDIDLLNDFRERTNQRHTFGDLCLSTDTHATNQAIIFYKTGGKSGSTSCRYLECGFIGDNEVVLEVTKTPLFDLSHPCRCWDTHTYTVGNAVDVSYLCDSKIKHAHQCVAAKQGERLQPGVFWLFPGPEQCQLLEDELSK